MEEFSANKDLLFEDISFENYCALPLVDRNDFLGRSNLTFDKKGMFVRLWVAGVLIIITHITLIFPSHLKLTYLRVTSPSTYPPDSDSLIILHFRSYLYAFSCSF